MGERGHTGRGRPIFFSAPMVRALLDGRKTQTRRILKPQPYRSQGEWLIDDRYSQECRLYDWVNDRCGRGPLVQAGDRLWVRESGQLLREAYDHDPRQSEDLWRDAGFYHSADGEIVAARSYDMPIREWIDDCARINRPSIHMPRWASRLTLTVTDARVQRLQEITLGDICSEGLARSIYDFKPVQRGFDAWVELWEGINGAGSWGSNPWVAAYTFTVERRNIDAPTPTGEASDV